MKQTVTPPENPFRPGSPYRDYQLQQEQWQFYSNANHDRWMRTRNAGVAGDYGGYGGGGGYPAQHQSTAGEGMFALAILLGTIAVIVVVVVFVVRMVLSLIRRVLR